MIPKDKNIHERLGLFTVMLLGLIAIVAYTHAEPPGIALAICIAFGVIIVLANRWLSDANDID